MMGRHSKRCELALMAALLCGCGADDDNPNSSEGQTATEASTTGSATQPSSTAATANSEGAQTETATATDSGPTAGSDDDTLGTGDTDAPNTDPCSPNRAPRPEVALPTPHDNEYVIDLQMWGIANDGTDPIGTRERLNEAIVWAVDNDFNRIRVPAGTYLVGEKTNDIYTSGIAVESDMTLVFDEGAVLQMATNDTWNYCTIEVTGKSNVTITGGEIRGDRNDHIYEGGGAHDEGHGICVENESAFVLIDNVEINEVTGDGVLIVGAGGDGTSCTDITIRNSELHHNRRQGVSIVGGVRVLIEDNEIHHIEGTSPQFGIDIESLAYISGDILIRNNSFHDNKGGDYVNTDGTNVWFEENVLDQGDLVDQVDGPIVHWKNTDQTIRGNTVTMTSRSVNGLWGVIGYTSNEDPRTNPAANYIEDNTFHGCGIHMANNSLYHVTNNVLDEWMILGSRISCVRLNDNQVTKVEGESYKFREVSGTAHGNTLNGQPMLLPMSDDAPFTNSPPHLW